MESKMINCYDYRQLEVPKELGNWRYPESMIANELEILAREHSNDEEVSLVKEGVNVSCCCLEASSESWKGRHVLLYPGRRLPGAEEAEQEILGKKKGDEITCCIKDIRLTLKIEQIVRKHVIKVSDELILLLNISNVQTVEDYYRWYHEKHDNEYREKACIRISQYWLEEISKRSEFQIEEEEKRKWCVHRAHVMYDSFVAADIDPRKQQDGTVLTKEETIENLAQSQEMYFVPYLMYRYFCEKDDFVLTEQDFEEELAKMSKERGATVQELKKQADFELFKTVKYQEHAFHILMKEAEKYLEE